MYYLSSTRFLIPPLLSLPLESLFSPKLCHPPLQALPKILILLNNLLRLGLHPIHDPPQLLLQLRIINLDEDARAQCISLLEILLLLQEELCRGRRFEMVARGLLGLETRLAHHLGAVGAAVETVGDRVAAVGDEAALVVFGDEGEVVAFVRVAEAEADDGGFAVGDAVVTL